MSQLRDIARAHRLRWSARLGAALEEAFGAGRASCRTAGRRGPTRLDADPAGADLVRRVHRRRAEGASFAAIAGELNAAGLRTRRGGEWTRATVHAVATRYPAPAE